MVSELKVNMRKNSKHGEGSGGIKKKKKKKKKIKKVFLKKEKVKIFFS